MHELLELMWVVRLSGRALLSLLSRMRVCKSRLSKIEGYWRVMRLRGSGSITSGRSITPFTTWTRINTSNRNSPHRSTLLSSSYIRDIPQGAQSQIFRCWVRVSAEEGLLSDCIQASIQILTTATVSALILVRTTIPSSRGGAIKGQIPLCLRVTADWRCL